MPNTEKRIAALEACASDNSLKIIVVEDGEAPTDALTSAGLQFDARGVLWCTPMDAMI